MQKIIVSSASAGRYARRRKLQ